MSDTIEHVGLVVIGRNEGPRLTRCLASVAGGPAPVVYVDSASTDDSVERARAAGVHVVPLDDSRPLSAARGRNAGFEHLATAHPSLRYVQFIDGDCEIQADWLEHAAAALDEHPEWAIVCGRLRERERHASIYNRLCDLEWDRPAGEIAACGGIFMIRIDAFRQVDGFNECIAAGEEPDLCWRLREAGWLIHRLPADMATHDANMHQFSQWWRRAVRSGHAYAEAAWRHGRESDRFGVRESASIWFWSFGWPFVILLLSWPTGGWALLGFAAYPLHAMKIFRAQRTRGRSSSDAWLYAVFCVIGKWAQWTGQLKFLCRKLMRRKPRIIEYKQPTMDRTG